MNALIPSNRIRAAVVLVAVAAVVACNGADVAAPASPATAPAYDLGALAGLQSLGVAARPTTPVRCTPHTPFSGRGRIGPHGGVIVIGTSRLVIPRGALREAITITGTATGDTSSTIDFQPHGLRFQKPALLTLSGAGCMLPQDGTPDIVYLGTDGQVLERIPARYAPRTGQVTANIAHFSGYAIAF